MASTNFVNGTVVQADWLNDVNKLAYGDPSGAGMVGFQPAGTGSVARWVEDKLSERVSLLDFIPPSEHAAIKAGTSTYDCTTAFELAVKYVADAGGIVFLPAGTIVCDADIDWSGIRTADGFPSWTTFAKNKAFTIQGEGGLSVIKAKSGGKGFALRIAYPIKIDGTQIHRHNIRLRDFEVDLNGEKKGIELVQAKSSVVECVNFYNGADGTGPGNAYALGCYETGMLRVRDLNIIAPSSYTGSSGIYLHGLGTADARITGCDIGGYGHGIYYKDGPGDLMVDGNVIYNQGVNCVTVETSARDSSQNRILNNHFGEPAGNMVSLSDGAETYASLNTNVSHNFFWCHQDKGDGVVMGRSLRTIVADNTFDFINGGVGSGKAAIRIKPQASRWHVHHNIINNLVSGGTGIDVAGIYGEVDHNTLQACADTAGTYFIALQHATAQRIGVSFNTHHQGGTNHHALYQSGQIGTLRVECNRFWGGSITARTDVNRQEIDARGVFGGSDGFRLIASTWNVNPLRLAGYYLWVSATAPNTGKLMIKAGAPTSDNDGTIVGTQT